MCKCAPASIPSIKRVDLTGYPESVETSSEFYRRCVAECLKTAKCTKYAMSKFGLVAEDRGALFRFASENMLLPPDIADRLYNNADRLVKKHWPKLKQH